MPFLKKILPITTWLPRYGWGHLRGDLVAGLTVGVMLIPQGMAYAILAGVPPIYGLYASLVPLLIYPLFGTSRHLAIGIMAIDMLILSAGLSLLADPGTDAYLGLAFVLALMVGLIQMAMGLARLGFVVNLLSRPVITGFTAAAALTIGFSQLTNLLGIDLPRTPYIYTLLWETAQNVGDIHVITLLIGLVGITLLLALRRWLPWMPGPLLAVVLGTVAVWWFQLEGGGVEIVGDIPTGLPMPTVPKVNLPTLRALLPTAVTLSLVQFMSVISLGKVFAAKHRYTVKANHELFALGALNFFGSFFRSIPVSGSFSRSAVGEQAGGKTALTNAVAAIVIGLTLLFLTPLFYYLPIAVFASIIMVAAFGMVNVAEIRFLLRSKRIDGLIAILTFLATLIIGIQEGVLIGIAASVVAIMYRISRPHMAELGHLPGTRSFRDVKRYKNAEKIPGLFILRVDASFSFANAEYLRDRILRQIKRQDDLRAVIIDASSINDLDMTATAVLKEIADTLEGHGIGLYFAGVKGSVRDVIRKSGLAEHLGENHFFLSPHRAVSTLLDAWDRAAPYLATVPSGNAPPTR